MFATMGGLGQDPDHGCGRAFWEYGDRLETYGTPMAPMLLPYFTDGCIGSMEGLYFESSATTPYHFLMQCELSDERLVRAARPAYHALEFDLGIQQLQLLGVRYYMAYTQWAVGQADVNDGAHAGGDHRPVARLRARPRRVGARHAAAQQAGRDAQRRRHPGPVARPVGGLVPRPDRWDVPLASDGPDDWPRVTIPADPIEPGRRVEAVHRRAAPCPTVPTEAVTPAKVTNIETGDDGISFDVDRVGLAGPGQGVRLPELGGLGRRGPVPGHPQPDGGGADRAAREPALRPHERRLPRDPPDAGRHRLGSSSWPAARPSRCPSPSGRTARRRRPPWAARRPRPRPGGAGTCRCRGACRPHHLDRPLALQVPPADAPRLQESSPQGSPPPPAVSTPAVAGPARALLRRFATIGLVATAVDIGLLVVLARAAGWPVLAADAVAITAARVRLVPRPPGDHLRRRPVGAVGPGAGHVRGHGRARRRARPRGARRSPPS